MAILEVSNIRKQFNNTAVLKDISFSLEEGNALAIIGSSGSGKTTIADIILGILIPEKGGIFVDGTNINDNKCE